MNEFEEVIGYEPIKKDLERIADIIRNPEKYQKLGVKMPQGTLLHGEPGVGKTLMANCFIKACGVKSYVCRKNKSDGDFVNEIKNTFDTAKQNAPSVVLLDDLDKFANEDDAHRNAEEYVTVQSCIDNVKGSGVYVFATANSLVNLPGSLLRIGRFDNIIRVTSPSGADAIKIVKFYLDKKKTLNIDETQVAKILSGSSCAELESIINQAGVYAGFENKSQIDMDDMMRAILRIKFRAPESAEEIPEDDLSEYVVHEAGHTVVAEHFNPNCVTLVSVGRHGGSIGGITMVDKCYGKWTKKRFDEEIMRLLAGRAATEIVLGITDAGSNSDVEEATRILRDNAESRVFYGFDKVDFCFQMSQEHQARKEKVVYREINYLYEEVKTILNENAKFLGLVIDALMKKRTIIGKDISEIRKKL